MRKVIAATAATAGLMLGSATMAGAAENTTTSDPNDVEAINNPVDENDDGGFDDWGLLGLLGLLGLGGLAKKNKQPVERTVYTGTNDPGSRSAR